MEGRDGAYLYAKFLAECYKVALKFGALVTPDVGWHPITHDDIFVKEGGGLLRIKGLNESKFWPLCPRINSYYNTGGSIWSRR